MIEADECLQHPEWPYTGRRPPIGNQRRLYCQDVEVDGSIHHVRYRLPCGKCGGDWQYRSDRLRSRIEGLLAKGDAITDWVLT